MNTKLFSLSFLLFFATHIMQARDDWQLWINTGTKGNPIPDIEVLFDQEYRIRNNIHRFEYFHLDPAILVQFQKGQWVGFQYRQIFDRDLALPWGQEAEPTIILRNTFISGGFDFYSNLRILYRIQRGQKPHGAIRFKPGLNLYKAKNFSIYIEDEIFYNYNNFQEFDQNRVYIGFNAKFYNALECGLYYMIETRRPADEQRLLERNVIGIVVRARV